MKKIITLALTLFIFKAGFSQTVVSANFYASRQYPPYQNQQYNQPYYNNNNGGNFEARRIDEYYNRKINNVMNSYINPSRKMRIIHRLENEKRYQLHSIGCDYNDAGNYNNYDYNNRGYGWRR